MDITRWDPRFASLDRLPEDVTFYDCRTAPFRGYGLYDFTTGPVFRRMPAEAAEAVSPGVAALCRHTAGGRVRFRTDSPYIVVRAVLADATWMSHMTYLGSCGFAVYFRDVAPEGGGPDKPSYETTACSPDVSGGETMAWEGGGPEAPNGPKAAARSGQYAGQRYRQSVLPKEGGTDFHREAIEGVVRMPAERKLREITIYFPLYSGVKDLWLGLQEGAQVASAAPYRFETPVVYYGSSITQGGCASRPGNSYEGFISRRLDCDYINLGFSGSGRGEPAMAEYLAGLEASVFVLDYDHNAPDPEHLAATHEPLFLRYRRSHPATPVIMVSAPDYTRLTAGLKRRDIIRATYEKARAGGDENVYFIDGQELFRTGDPSDEDCTVDGSHPNDLGFYRMAQVIGDRVARCLGAAPPDAGGI